MKFNPQKYAIEDLPMRPFIDSDEIRNILKETENPSMEQVRAIVERSQGKHRLTLQETATLLNATTPEAIEYIKSAARQLKKDVYGDRIVLFAPLYIGNRCINNCSYCGFRVSNTKSIRKTLSDSEIAAETEALEDQGHKRLILVFGEHPMYDAQYIARCVRAVYGVKHGRGEIRRVNINAAPMEVEGFRTIAQSGIGTYQVFQETYDRELYAKYHLGGKKMDYDYRLTSLDRAMEAGIDDVGLGALMGLGPWQAEVMGLVRHTNHLEACYNVGPHTISFPRIKEASDVDSAGFCPVADDDFVRMIAILRLAVPYTGLILTARESAEVRDLALEFGVSQIDGGTNIEIGGYSGSGGHDLNRGQFEINDNRALGDIIDELIAKDYTPSFCTACYRKGRTGEHFMEFSTDGFIKRFCGPNALLTLAEYLEDYTSGQRYVDGWKAVNARAELQNGAVKERLERIQAGERDLYF